VLFIYFVVFTDQSLLFQSNHLESSRRNRIFSHFPRTLRYNYSMTAGPVQPSPRHRRQTFWQILLPVILASLGVIALIVLLSLGTARGTAPTGQWAAIATIWLVIPFLFITLLFITFTVVFIFLIARLRRGLPAYARLGQIYLQIFSLKVDSFLTRLSRPQIGLLSRWSGFKAVFTRKPRVRG